MTNDDGANSAPLPTLPTAGLIAAGRWSGIRSLAHVDVAHVQQSRFGIRASRLTSPGPVDLTGSQCQLRVLIFSRDGASSPL